MVGEWRRRRRSEVTTTALDMASQLAFGEEACLRSLGKLNSQVATTLSKYARWGGDVKMREGRRGEKGSW